jgi:hypothetical protein
VTAKSPRTNLPTYRMLFKSSDFSEPENRRESIYLHDQDAAKMTSQRNNSPRQYPPNDPGRFVIGKTRTSLPILTSDIHSAPRKGAFGWIEAIDADGIRGWAVDAAAPGEPQEIAVVLDDTVIYRGRCDAVRSDVSEFLDRPAKCGFQLRWRDVMPEEPLKGAEERRGEILVRVGVKGVLKPSAEVPAAQLYGWCEPYIRRIALIFGVTHVVRPRGEPDRELVSESFDEAFYKAMYGAQLEDGESPLLHFMEKGWRLGFDPNCDFSVSHYLSSYPDLAEAGINPFVHYLRTGRQEGRQPVPSVGVEVDALRRQEALEETVAMWRRSEPLRTISARAMILRIDEALEAGGHSAVALSFSHDDYTRHVGGVQLCIAKEASAFTARDTLYVHVSPWQPLPVLAAKSSAERLPLRIVCAGREFGNILGVDLVALAEHLRTRLPSSGRFLTVHALHGHSPELIAAAQVALQPSDALFWLHDYFSLCTGYNLLRNGVRFCGAPARNSGACGICVYGKTRSDHVDRIVDLIQSAQYRLVSPSSFTARLWQSLHPIGSHAEVVVHPHCRIVEDGKRMQPWFPGDDASSDVQPPIKIAFLGHPAMHKGWHVFERVVRRFAADDRYRFLHLGTRSQASLPIEFHEVKAGPDSPDAMIHALEDMGVDVALQWSIWPETFGITARECTAAGALVLAAASSGAVADFVTEADAGLVLSDEQQLISFLEGKELSEKILERRSQGVTAGHLHWSGLSADLVSAGAWSARLTTQEAKSATGGKPGKTGAGNSSARKPVATREHSQPA